jgi:peptidoglycan/xylan/chitin deacetylase (PgdA/CDA1 family)
LYLALWEKLKPLRYEQIETVITNLRQWAGDHTRALDEELPMSNQQLSDLKNHSWIDVGIHTVSHPALSFHTQKNQQKEIAECRQYLEAEFEKPADTMAYPYGDYDELTIKVVSDQKLKAVFTTEERAVTKDSDPFRLGRFQVRNWNGIEFEARLARWIREY